MSKNKLVVSLDGGLVNKMLAYMSVKALSKIFNKDLYIYWTPHLHGLCESLFVLFDDKDTHVIGIDEYKNYLASNHLILSKEELINIENVNLLDGDLVIKEFYLELHPKIISDEVWDVEMKSIWDALKIKPSILHAVPHLDPNTITLHVRRHHQAINISMDTYESIILNEINSNPEVKFFITTDNLEDKNHLTSLFPGRCFINEISTYWDVKNDAGVIDAFIDILTINQTRKIYTPGGSTFTYLSKYVDKKIDVIHINNDQ